MKTDPKLFAGPRIRRFRKSLGLTQVQMAHELDVSASYLNLIERNQRPVSARVLLQLADTFDLDLRSLARDVDKGLLLRVRETVMDPVVESAGLDTSEVHDFVENHPKAAEALVRTFDAYRAAATGAADLAGRLSQEEGYDPAQAAHLPLEDVRNALHARDNYFPALESLAERMVQALKAQGLRSHQPGVHANLFDALKQRLRDVHGLTTMVLPTEAMGEVLRRFDRHNRRILLHEHLSPPARQFALAIHCVLLDGDADIEAQVQASALASDEARRLYRLALANYAAGALVMPYAAFLKACQETRYDIDTLLARFSASYEQVAHRLTTLKKPGSRGIAFFMIRTDPAGNITKRFGGDVFAFARGGGSCARWFLYDTFRTPGEWRKGYIELSPNERFFTLARTVEASGGTPDMPVRRVVGIGCRANDAGQIRAADGLDARIAAEVGVNCRLCERMNCAQRAFPPMQRALYVDPHHRSQSVFSFR